MDPITILAALGPLAVDLGKSLIGRFVNKGDFRPATIADWLAMRKADAEMFAAMNASGGPPSYPWVEAVVRLQRPAVAAIALLTWAWLELTTPGGAPQGVVNFASSVGFYLFGDRTLFYARKAGTQ